MPADPGAGSLLQARGGEVMMRFLLAVVVTGILLNLTGWAGNVFLLGSMWMQAGAQAPPPMPTPFSLPVHITLQFVSDFVFAFVLCSVYVLARPAWRGSHYALAFLCGAIVWLGGVPMAYLGLINGGYLPIGISVATTVLALVTFFIVAPLLPVLLPGSRAAAR
jgi:hypothetical protein